MRYALGITLVLVAGVAIAPGAAAQQPDKGTVGERLAGTRLDLTCEATPLEAVVKQIADATGVAIVVDERVYKRFTAEQLAVTMKAEKLSGAKALELVCQLLGLEMGVDKGCVRIQDRSGRPIEVAARAFYVGDLALALRDFPGPPLGTGLAYPPRFREGRAWHEEDGPSSIYGPYYGWHYYDRDADAVPLGTPYYEAEPSFERPPYQGRARNAPFEMENYGEIAALARRIQLATGGRENWSRPGVGMSVERGSRLVVTHSPAVLAAIAAWLVEERKAPPPHDRHAIPIEPVD